MILIAIPLVLFGFIMICLGYGWIGQWAGYQDEWTSIAMITLFPGIWVALIKSTLTDNLNYAVHQRYINVFGGKGGRYKYGKIYNFIYLQVIVSLLMLFFYAFIGVLIQYWAWYFQGLVWLAWFVLILNVIIYFINDAVVKTQRSNKKIKEYIKKRDNNRNLNIKKRNEYIKKCDDNIDKFKRTYQLNDTLSFSNKAKIRVIQVGALLGILSMIWLLMI